VRANRLGRKVKKGFFSGISNKYIENKIVGGYMGQIKVMVIGNVYRDIFLYFGREPEWGESLEGSKFFRTVGGKAANQAVALSRLGGQTEFVGAVGNDQEGVLLEENLKENGVGTRHIIHADGGSGLAVVYVAPDGRNKNLVFSEASKSITQNDIDRAFDEHYDAVIILFELCEELVIHSCRKAAKKGIPVIIDAGPAKSFDLEELSQVEIFSPNETEAQALCGFALTNESQEEKAAKILFDRSRAKYVIIKLGERGSLLYDGKISRYFKAKKVDAVDTTGAGDAFMAALTLEYIRRNDIAEAIDFASSVAALAVLREGSQPSFPTLDEVKKRDSLLRK
jgi:ribokinase